ncbi:hypothetical protein SAMN04515667_2081 [Formosa sp. Hel1_31_208]|uniref:hypothetical protein n=1 Tax=Formosa sp. Hel1_31_208 TaxID=1798225 RepID=UPI00087D4F71|nr:hypothetical protein [Formosa sp. Hel1_31_208]SDS39709.1 hypothetical protein SAMN04515667_2081 [Formosa sp. Hel1_31_208]
MKYILTFLLALVFYTPIFSQNELKKEIQKDGSYISELLTKADSISYEYSKRSSFEAIINKAFMYYDERIIYYSNHDKASNGLYEIGFPKEEGYEYSKKDFLTFLKQKLQDPIIELSTKADNYNLLCEQISINPAINNEAEIREIIAVYDSYDELTQYYNSLKRALHLDDLSYARRNENYSTDKIECKVLRTVLKDYDKVDTAIVSYLEQVDSVNKKFFALPTQHQNLRIIKKRDQEIERELAANENDTDNERSEKNILRADYNSLSIEYFYYFNGFRGELDLRNYYTQYNEITTKYAREFLEGWMKEKGCI